MTRNRPKIHHPPSPQQNHAASSKPPLFQHRNHTRYDHHPITGCCVGFNSSCQERLQGHWCWFEKQVGGELKAYTQLLQESRNEALYRMLVDAQSRGANAVVNVRFATSSVSGGAAELLAYGTAVTVQ